MLGGDGLALFIVILDLDGGGGGGGEEANTYGSIDIERQWAAVPDSPDYFLSRRRPSRAMVWLASRCAPTSSRRRRVTGACLSV